jgi:hypothetical protein
MSELNKTIRLAVTNALAEAAPQVSGRVIEHYVAKEVARRTDVVIKGLDKAAELQKELRKIDRPDHVTFDKEGKPAHESYTKERLEALKKANEQLVKFEKAIEKALVGEVEDLAQLVGK